MVECIIVTISSIVPIEISNVCEPVIDVNGLRLGEFASRNFMGG